MQITNQATQTENSFELVPTSCDIDYASVCRAVSFLSHHLLLMTQADLTNEESLQNAFVNDFVSMRKAFGQRCLK